VAFKKIKEILTRPDYEKEKYRKDLARGVFY
jgi:hypothetical protein